MPGLLALEGLRVLRGLLLLFRLLGGLLTLLFEPRLSLLRLSLRLKERLRLLSLKLRLRLRLRLRLKLRLRLELRRTLSSLEYLRAFLERGGGLPFLPRESDELVDPRRCLLRLRLGLR